LQKPEFGREMGSSGTGRKLSRSKEDLDYTQLRVAEAHRGVGKVD
jgi:hypothetical protein